MESLKIGSRIHCDGEFGTVLYIGELEGKEETWLGIEWDDPSKFGRHNGTYNNVSYFKTSVSNAGSFIKLLQVNAGISCAEAIKAKYGNNWIADCTTMPQETGYDKLIEMVGMEKICKKQNNYSRLTDVSISNKCVNRSGQKNELAELIPRASSLDLSLNLLTSWTDVADVASQLLLLHTLILSKNRLKIPDELEKYQSCFPALKMLVMNDMTYTWKEVMSCAVMWPYIEELFIVNNKVSILQEPPYPIFCKLSLLNMNGNPIKEWKEICKLGRLTNLEELHLDNTQLESICFPDVPPTEKTNLFPNLKILSIRNNELKQWQDISELNKLVKLKSLMVNNNPVIGSISVDATRQLVIAKLSGLEKLNKSEIFRAERRGAELDYIKKHHGEWLASGGHLDFNISKPSEYFLSQHPTYMQLIKKHGVAEEGEIHSSNTLLKSNLVPVKLFTPLIPEMAPVIKKLPAQMTIEKVKVLVQRIFKIPYQDIILTCFVEEDENRPIEMDNDLRELAFYSITDKDKIAVEW